MEDEISGKAHYFTALIREDVVEFSRLHEINTMRLFVELLRERVGSPLSMASIARDLAISPTTLKRYLDVLQALYIVFTVQPWHHNVARAILQTPKVYFFDTGLVRGDDGVRLENAVAARLSNTLDSAIRIKLIKPAIVHQPPDSGRSSTGIPAPVRPAPASLFHDEWHLAMPS